MQKQCRARPALLVGAIIFPAVLESPARDAPAGSGIRFDGSFGKPSGAPGGNLIKANRGLLVGTKKANLFHSFSDFNIGSNQTVRFEVPGNTRNILARVTGENASSIHGTIATTGPANLYLMNPNGIVFGEGAQVDVRGAFTATTADYIAFKDEKSPRGLYRASGDRSSVLVSSAPSKFGFLDPQESGSGNLIFSDISGNPEADRYFSRGDFSAVGREIHVKDSEVYFTRGGFSLRTTGSGEIGTQGLSEHGDAPSASGGITLTRSSLLSYNGKDLNLSSAGGLKMDGTVLNVSGRNTIRLSSGRDTRLQGGSIQHYNTAKTPSGRIRITSGRGLFVSNKASIVSASQNEGRGADISISTRGDISLTKSASIRTEASGGHQGGDIIIHAGKTVEISSFGNIRSDADEISSGGDIDFRSGELRIQGPAKSSNPKDDPLVGIESSIEGGSGSQAPAGRGGNIRIEVDGRISIKSTGGIFSSTDGAGSSGSIHVNSGSLHIAGGKNITPETRDRKPRNFFITGISNKGSRDSSGSLGDVRINVINGLIHLTGGGFIDSTNFSRNSRVRGGDVFVTAGGIYADRGTSDYFTGIGAGTEAESKTENAADGGGNGGLVEVRAGSITLLNGAQIAASSRSDGDAGKITVATDHLIADGRNRKTKFLFTGESGVVAATLGSSDGNGGDISIQALGGTGASFIRLSNKAEIGARVDGSGIGGSVEIVMPGGSVELRSGSSISARSDERGGTAGSVFLEAANVSLTGCSSISSRNDTQGTARNAGSVTLRPGTLSVHHSQLEVSAENGDGGNLVIEGGLLLDFLDADLVAKVSTESGTGGDVLIQGARDVVIDDTRVTATAVEGLGGNIRIGPVVLLKQGEILDASSEKGADGLVAVESQVALTGAENQLEGYPLDATDQLQPECTQRLATKAGSFIKAGRGGSPRLPGGYLPSIRLQSTVR